MCANTYEKINIDIVLYHIHTGNTLRIYHKCINLKIKKETKNKIQCKRVHCISDGQVDKTVTI